MKKTLLLYFYFRVVDAQHIIGMGRRGSVTYSFGEPSIIKRMGLSCLGLKLNGPRGSLNQSQLLTISIHLSRSRNSIAAWMGLQPLRIPCPFYCPAVHTLLGWNYVWHPWHYHSPIHCVYYWLNSGPSRY